MSIKPGLGPFEGDTPRSGQGTATLFAHAMALVREPEEEEDQQDRRGPTCR